MGVGRTSAVPALAGALTVGAGLVHATAAGNHGGDTAVVALLALTAVGQVCLGMAAAVRPGRLTLSALAGLNLVVLGVWMASRTTGVPFVAGLAEPESVGLQDATAMVMGFAGAFAAFVALLQGAADDARRPALSPLWGLAVVPALVGMTAPHTHSSSHDHSATEAGAHSHGAPVPGGNTTPAADPIFSGADTAHASEKELSAAKALIETTRESVSRRFPDKAALLAAGYRSIGDGFPLTRYEHFVNGSYLTDGREVDPDHIESIVLEGTGSGARVVSAMYILEAGKTMSDTPDIAGDLTTWHDHQDLCWDASGTRLAGVLVRGRCLPAGVFRPTPPMLHVWLQEHPCGPFAGIEGHGEACTGHTH